jgi:hypothetical protein
LAITIAFIDKPIRDAAQSNRSSSTDDFFRKVEKFGSQYALPMLVGFYAVGTASDDYNTKTVALDGFSAAVISSWRQRSARKSPEAARIIGIHSGVTSLFRPVTRPARLRSPPLSLRTTTTPA